ncbi:60S ribosomal protein L14 [Plasmodium brasilianum]|uniref:60S ribosomal protein L14, putative n=2 Tax=Plasmodium (Plasmodium) TaxID=418103 RepID=A0A1A8WE37_PLAMA|nr:60S ribosomal protein L14, putative [Plasmodium malariae]KAI4835706.1 60S ribosomal protein L14 [Plasmodium brasilianum]SBS89465.1 60S ribosomal protein L14, putative [Plasmodium malariae]SBT72150.1 60S ribosomal protein L14, putative [Plasmodium malariae]SCP02638.1 60S ribosomal protein L14, putative [Plasmodium malariae]
MPRVELTEEEKLNLTKKNLLFKRFVEPGRLCLVEYGPYAGKLCFVIDIVTLTRVIVDGGFVTGVPRMIMPLKRLKLLKERIKIKKNCKSGYLRKTINSTKILESFKESNLGKKIIVKKKRDLATDYERFQVYYARRALKKKIASLIIKKNTMKKKGGISNKEKTKKVNKTAAKKK